MAKTFAGVPINDEQANKLTQIIMMGKAGLLDQGGAGSAIYETLYPDTSQQDVQKKQDLLNMAKMYSDMGDTTTAGKIMDSIYTDYMGKGPVDTSGAVPVSELGGAQSWADLMPQNQAEQTISPEQVSKFNAISQYSLPQSGTVLGWLMRQITGAEGKAKRKQFGSPAYDQYLQYNQMLGTNPAQ